MMQYASEHLKMYANKVIKTGQNKAMTFICNGHKVNLLGKETN